ncbi:hypothetical protein LCGC14_2052420 [marine sediment metagenome]|uniref:Uncharacterized protein n=1 Tax=marine sediment metagenome TaxID=412755 RepID=A0A0F9ENK0_9ZZZZ
MKAITDYMRFESEGLQEIITIQEFDGIWGFESTSGYNTHGSVDYSSFKNNKLIKRDGLIVLNRVNNYGMKLIRVK